MFFEWLHALSYLLLLSWTVTAEQFYIIPSSNTSCPRDPCYTLTDVVLNPSQYFESNSTIILLAGNHQTNITGEFSVLIKDVRNISMIGYDHTNTDSKSVIQCTGSLGFAFINVTTLKIARLSFTSCGAHFPSAFTEKEIFVYPHDFRTKIYFKQVTFYFLHTTNVTISEVAIVKSTEAGLLGINMFGLSNISQTIFTRNRPNCLIIFLETPSTSQALSPTHLSIEVLYVTLGKGPKYLSWCPGCATGLGITLAQTTYNVHIYINNIIMHRNKKIREWWYGNLHFFVVNWECQCSIIQAKQITSANKVKWEDTTRIHLHSDSTLPTCNCSKEEEYTVKISDSYFEGVGILVDTDSKYCTAQIKMHNITVQNSSTFPLRIGKMKSIELQDVKFAYNHYKEKDVTS